MAKNTNEAAYYLAKTVIKYDMCLRLCVVQIGLKWGAGKTTYMFSANANVLSANFPFSMLPAGGAGMGQAAETESTLVLAENIYVNLPTPFKMSLVET